MAPVIDPVPTSPNQPGLREGIHHTAPNSITPAPNILVTREADLPTSPLAQHNSFTPSHSVTTEISPKVPNNKILEALSPKYQTQPMTAASALAGQRCGDRGTDQTYTSRLTSPNPATAVLGTLLNGNDANMSKPGDVPAEAQRMSDGLAAAAKEINLSDPMQVDANPQSSPVSTSSISSLSNANRPVIVAPPTDGSKALVSAVIPVTSLGLDASDVQSGTTTMSEGRSSSEEQSANRSFTFPGPRQADSQKEASRNPTRGASLPMSGAPRSTGQSASVKKHKCPYCSTNFTRHHNLKSHLLTHSHEKPFFCSTCHNRFRRLHDLKRHSKLHTGERPHTCQKCGRSFARGDALARHTKGQGGCAGRRASQGDVVGDDESVHDDEGGEDGSMDGLLYTGSAVQRGDGAANGHATAARDDSRRTSLSTARRRDEQASTAAAAPASVSAAAGSSQVQGMPSTYPPGTRGDNSRQPRRYLHPHRPSNSSFATGAPLRQPTVSSPQVPGSTASPAPLGAGGSSILSHGGMTESPKPISPGGPGGLPSHQLGPPDSASINRRRSPSLTQQFQQHHYGRNGSGRPSPPMGLPPIQANSQAPQLPSLPGLSSPGPRISLPGQSSAAQQVTGSGNQVAGSMQQYGVASSLPNGSTSGNMLPGGTSTAGSVSTQGQSSVDGINALSAMGTDGVWVYIRSLEDKINKLTEEVTALKNNRTDQGR
ncbi:MAG: hypothetical protein M1825_004727 [Sarcosagium campestre]|nr:MAG: hypothetical protein M1825_004727 [Sarcosagium campestre]